MTGHYLSHRGGGGGGKKTEDFGRDHLVLERVEGIIIHN